MSVHKTNDIVVRAPLTKVFSVASNLPRWPEYLSHYRYNRYIRQSPSGGLVKMACSHGGITIKSVCEFRIEPENAELHFHYVSSTLNAVRGMRATWEFQELLGDLVRVTINHDFEAKLPLFGRVLELLAADRFFVKNITPLTLAGLKRKAETQVLYSALGRS